MLSAAARNLDVALRAVMVARDRQFRWPAISKFELVISSAAPFRVMAVEDSAGDVVFRRGAGTLVRGTGAPALSRQSRREAMAMR